MRFSIDAHAIGRNLTGNEVYVRSLLNAFATLDRYSEFIAYISVKEAETRVPARFSTRLVAANPFLRLGGDLTRRLRQDRPDLVHVQYTAPLGCPVPIVATVHDVGFLEHPEFFPRARAIQLRWSVRRTIRSAAKILTVSEFSRGSIMKAYDLDGEKIVVAHNAAAQGLRPLNREKAISAVLARFGIQPPFVLAVGDLQPRKNHIGLIHAFTDLVRACPQLRHQLVIAGKWTWFAPRVYGAAKQSGISDRIHFLGFVSDDDLLQLYNACELFVFPSFYEGFGLPLLEAMVCGRAVICSNTSSMPEVADSAAILFDPYSSKEMTRAMVDVLLDPELRARLERLGLQRSSHFSWQRTARKTLEVYHEVAERFHPVNRRARSLLVPRP